MSKSGIREQKKARTHQLIVEAATNAFLENGFENVTLEEIAERADVGRRTLVRYFPTKVHLVLWGQYEALRLFKEAVANRGDQEILDVWQTHVREGADLLAKHGRQANVRLFAGDEPAIKQAYVSIQAEYQKIIFDGLLVDYGVEKHQEIEAAVMAAALVGGNYIVGSIYLEREAYHEIPDAVGRVIEIVRAGLAPKS